MKRFVVAWLASSLAFSIAFVCFMIIWNWLDQNPPTWAMIFKLAWVTVGVALAVQFFCGGLIYLVLTRIGLWHWWTVVLPYLLLWTLAWEAVDTFREAWGMIAWLALVFLTAWVLWFMARAATPREPAP